MPFKSAAQRRKFLSMVESGEMSQETYDRWEAETGDAILPERVGKPAPASKPAKRKPSTSKARGRSAGRGKGRSK